MPSTFKTFSETSFTVAYALWLFTGFFGGHRFYLDRKKTGIVQFLVLVVNFGILFYAFFYSFQQPSDQEISDGDSYLESLFAVITSLFFVQIIWLLIDFFWLYFAVCKKMQNYKFERQQIEAFE